MWEHPSVIEVVLADDSEHFRHGLAAVLRTEPDLRIVGEAASGEELIELVGRHAPDVAVVDLRMPGTGGVAAISAVRAISPVTRVVVLTVSDDDEDLLAAIVAGAHGYLLKDSAIEQVPAAIHDVLEGGSPLSPVVAAALWTEYSSLLAAGRIPEALDPNEECVLRLLSNGASPGQIATSLNIPRPVVEHEVRDLVEKVHLAAQVGAGR